MGSQLLSLSVIAAFMNLLGAVLSANSKWSGLPKGEASTCSAGKRSEAIFLILEDNEIGLGGDGGWERKSTMEKLN